MRPKSIQKSNGFAYLLTIYLWSYRLGCNWSSKDHHTFVSSFSIWKYSFQEQIRSL